MSNPGRFVVIVGTWHKFQEGRSGAAATSQLRKRLSAICRRYRVASISEEESPDALALLGVSQTVAGRLAAAMNIPHRLCDLSRDERAALGLWEDARVEKVMRYEGRCDEFKREQSRQWTVRENCWLTKITELNVWPALFVCGASHAQRFAELVQRAGMGAVVAERAWQPVGSKLDPASC